MRTSWLHAFLFLSVIIGCGHERSAPSSYVIRDGMAMVEGDIIVGEANAPAEKVERFRKGLAVPANWRWPKGRIAYVIDPALPDQWRVTQAIEHFHQRTKLVFIKRTTQTAFIRFKAWGQGYCRSWIGRVGTAQNIDLDGICDTRSVIHEIGHAVGLYHEHSRSDRDKFVRIHRTNIIPGLEWNLNKQLTYSVLLGPYDYQSVMHYRWWELSRNGQPVLTKLDGSTDGLSNPDGLSAGDSAVLLRIYPGL